MAPNAAKELDRAKPLTIVEGTGVRSRFLPRSAEQALEKVMGTNRPFVNAHLRFIKNAHPGYQGDALVAELERRYLATIAATGAAAGATAALPVIGTVAALGVSATETLAFLEATTLFAQSLAEVHGFASTDPQKTRALVLALLLGPEGASIIRQWGAETLHREASRTGYWEQIVTAQLPGFLVGSLVNRLRKRLVRTFAGRETTNIVLRALPCGIGALFGGLGNRALGRRVIEAAREAFGPLTLDTTADF